MIYHTSKESKIYNDFTDEQNNYWFDMKRQKKFLHEIDTYYYTITIDNDWYTDSNVRNFKAGLRMGADNFSPKYVKNGYHFGFYNFDLELPEQYLILIAENVPNEKKPLTSLSSYEVITCGYMVQYVPMKRV